ncbi:type II toxin-antitoxin system HicA family toxin [Chitinophaga barathri]|uniref:Type II toxin-antitoxin system HicA family toxin n=1 Tax=Chitinophaga barathri TaxID=1647451 RepID=A0A3N4MD33_9BACT|nr:type II toxin-antitoxin system HicA family toxin [Chitinophaga barathri]RPD41345.1 type II toxin-antitoxin system HicA family toxin [Chitinophaga barathri]
MSKCSEILRRLERAGWRVLRQGKGSHIILVHPDKPGTEIIFSDHGSREIGKGLERKYLKQAGLI